MDTNANGTFWDPLDKFKPETPEEKARRIGVPVIPARPAPRPQEPNPVIAVCGACGIELHRFMGYYCPRSDCPCGLGSRATF